MPCQGACSVDAALGTEPVLGPHGCGVFSPRGSCLLRVGWEPAHAGSAKLSTSPLPRRQHLGGPRPAHRGHQVRVPRRCGARGWRWGGCTPKPSPAPLSPSPTRLDLSDIPNSVRLVAPDVGILLASSLCLCLCRRLVPKAGPAARGRRPESVDPLERVRADPGTVSSIPPAMSCRAPARIPRAWRPVPRPLLGDGRLGHRGLAWMGGWGPGWEQFHWRTGTSSRHLIRAGVTQPQRSARVCSRVAVGIPANSPALQSLPAGGGNVVPAPPGLQPAPPPQNPWAQEGQCWGGQSWDAGTQLELTGWVPCRAVPCRATPALPGGASGTPGCCAHATGVTQADTTPS